MINTQKKTSKKISDNIMEFKGKTFTKTGRLTLKFKKYAIENPSVLLPSQFVRVGDKIILKSKAFDKRFKTNVVKKKFSKPKKVFLKGDFEKVYEPKFFDNGEYKGKPINTDTFLFDTYKKISSGGDMIRVIVKAYDYDNDRMINEDFYQQTTQYFINTTKLPYIHKQETVDKAYDYVQKLNNYNGRVWEHIKGISCEDFLKNAVIKNKLVTHHLIKPDTYIPLLNFVKANNIHDPSYKQLIIGGTVHLQYPDAKCRRI